MRLLMSGKKSAENLKEVEASGEQERAALHAELLCVAGGPAKGVQRVEARVKARVRFQLQGRFEALAQLRVAEEAAELVGAREGVGALRVGREAGRLVVLEGTRSFLLALRLARAQARVEAVDGAAVESGVVLVRQQLGLGFGGAPAARQLRLVASALHACASLLTCASSNL